MEGANPVRTISYGYRTEKRGQVHLCLVPGRRTDRHRKVIEHIFDRLGRETEERWKDGQTTVRTISYGYNAAGQMISADDNGAEGRDYDYIYDQMGRLQETQWRSAGEGKRGQVHLCLVPGRRTDRHRKVIEHIFDRLGRETEERWMEGPTLSAPFPTATTPPVR